MHGEARGDRGRTEQVPLVPRCSAARGGCRLEGPRTYLRTRWPTAADGPNTRAMAKVPRVPEVRVRRLDDLDDALSDAPHVVYWMIIGRRPRYNFALERAVELAREHGKTLIVLEPLRCGYEHASDRLHLFAMQGMADNRRYFKEHGVRHYAYLERKAGEGKGLLQALATNAAAIVTDDYPCFFLPHMIEAAADTIEGVRFEAIDNNGVYPMHDADRTFTRAHSFRRHLQKRLPKFLGDMPMVEPCRSYEGGVARIDGAISERWPEASDAELEGTVLGELPIDHGVRPSKLRGGFEAAGKAMTRWLENDFPRYGEGRNHPDDDVASGLSPYLHWGHLAAHELFAEITRREDWSLDRLGKVTGSRDGWWGMSESAESFLDELITWREVGFNGCATMEDYDEYGSLPDWAKETLADHADDARDVYDLDVLENAETDDDIWNAAQRELTREGTMQNYLRMLWGKKILQWSETPQQALERMVYLNNKYALDGRDPNSYSGIFWVLGRYDRAWGPERDVFGKIRYMTSESTRKKLKLKDYLERYGA